MLEAHLSGSIAATVLDMTFYEVGNALLRKGLVGDELAEAVGLMHLWDLQWMRAASSGDVHTVGDIVARYELSFYDASYLAAAIAADIPLVTDDRALLLAATGEGVGVALEEFAP